MHDTTPTKREIREFLARTKKAARAIESWLDEEKKLRESGHWTASVEARLHDLAVELSGCGSEVQNLLDARYRLGQ